MPILTVTVPDELYEQLQKLASDMERTVEECHAYALEEFIAEERANMDSLLEGMRDIEEGRVVPHAEVMKWLDSLGTDSPLPRPTSGLGRERLAS